MFNRFRCIECGCIDWHNIWRRFRPGYYRRRFVSVDESPLTVLLKVLEEHRHCPARGVDFSSDLLGGMTFIELEDEDLGE